MTRKKINVRILKKRPAKGVRRVKIGTKSINVRSGLSDEKLIKTILKQISLIVRMLTTGGKIKKKLGEGYKPETVNDIVKLTQDKNLLMGKQREILEDAQKLKESKIKVDAKLSKSIAQLEKLKQQEKTISDQLEIVKQQKERAVKELEEQRKITDLSIAELKKEKDRADKLIELERKRNEGEQLRENINSAISNKAKSYKTAIKLFLWARSGNFNLPTDIGKGFYDNNDHKALAFILNTPEGSTLLDIANKYKLGQYTKKENLFADVAPLLLKYNIDVRDKNKPVKSGGILPLSSIDRQQENLSPSYIIDKLADEQKKDINELFLKLREIEENRDNIDDIVADGPAVIEQNEPLDEPVEEEELEGNGKDNGLLDSELDEMLKKQDGYLGTIASDEINKLKFMKDKDQGFIINTTTRDEGGQHWQAVFISPLKSRTVEFYDSYGDDPEPELVDELSRIMKVIKPSGILKFKINKVKHQGNSNNCGWFSMKFLIDRFNGKSFKEATGFKGGEAVIERFKDYYMNDNGDLIGRGKILDKLKEFNKKVKEKFKASLEKTKQKTKELGEKIKKGVSEGLRRLKEAFTGPKSLPPYIIDILEKTQGDPIVYADVARFPVNQKVINFLDLISMGKVKSRTKEMMYDNLYHLMLNVKLASGKVFQIDKRPKIAIKSFASLKSQQLLDKDKQLGGDVQQVPVKNANVDLTKLFEDGLKNAGSVDKFYNYSLENNNCQDFVMYLLNGQGWANEEVKKFVKQDIESIFKTDIGPQKQFANFVVKVKQFFDTLRGASKLVGGCDRCMNGGCDECMMGGCDKCMKGGCNECMKKNNDIGEIYSVILSKDLSGKAKMKKILTELNVLPYKMKRRGLYNELKINKKKIGLKYEPQILAGGKVILITVKK